MFNGYFYFEANTLVCLPNNNWETIENLYVNNLPVEIITFDQTGDCFRSAMGTVQKFEKSTMNDVQFEEGEQVIKCGKNQRFLAKTDDGLLYVEAGDLLQNAGALPFKRNCEEDKSNQCFRKFVTKALSVQEGSADEGYGMIVEGGDNFVVLTNVGEIQRGVVAKIEIGQSKLVKEENFDKIN